MIRDLRRAPVIKVAADRIGYEVEGITLGVVTLVMKGSQGLDPWTDESKSRPNCDLGPEPQGSLDEDIPSERSWGISPTPKYDNQEVKLDDRWEKDDHSPLGRKDSSWGKQATLERT